MWNCGYNWWNYVKLVEGQIWDTNIWNGSFTKACTDFLSCSVNAYWKSEIPQIKEFDPNSNPQVLLRNYGLEVELWVTPSEEIVYI